MPSDKCGARRTAFRNTPRKPCPSRPYFLPSACARGLSNFDDEQPRPDSRALVRRVFELAIFVRWHVAPRVQPPPGRSTGSARGSPAVAAALPRDCYRAATAEENMRDLIWQTLMFDGDQMREHCNVCLDRLEEAAVGVQFGTRAWAFADCLHEWDVAGRVGVRV